MTTEAKLGNHSRVLSVVQYCRTILQYHIAQRTLYSSSPPPFLPMRQYEYIWALLLSFTE